MRLIGEAQGVAYNEQVKALGGNNIAIIETLKVIGEKAFASRRTSSPRAVPVETKAVVSGLCSY
jgi:hypothetical protein